MLNYFEAIDKQGVTKLYEAKMLLIGEGGVGKTSLAVKLIDPTAELPNEEGSTKGIDILKYEFKTEEGNDFIINIWDFGGQQIYKATHQFFLTNRSLYILVDDTRRNDNGLDDLYINNWMETVKMFGKNSPLLIVQNEKNDRSKKFDLKSFKSQFDFIKELYETNIKSNRGLDVLEKDIKHYIQKLPHIGQDFPKKWLEIRNKLIELSEKKPYISLDNYYTIYKKYVGSLERDKARELSQYLHDLGTILHFQEDDILNKTIILQNEWATDAVYRVLDNEPIKKKKGHFSKEDLKEIWIEEEYQDMLSELLALMVKFELCYEIPEKKGHYLSPQLLPVEEPDNLNWDYNSNLQLRYQYGFMPKGIISSIIVKLHSKIKDLDKAWTKGVILENNNSSALIKHNFSKKEISIRINGKQQRDLMTIIVEEIDKINNKFSGIEVEKNVPCICEVCQTLEEPYFYKIEKLKEKYSNNEQTEKCDNKPYEKVSILKLLENIDKDFLKKEDERKEHYSVKIGNVDTFISGYKVKKIDTSKIKIKAPNEPKPIKEEWFEKWIVISALVGFVVFLYLFFMLPSVEFKLLDFKFSAFHLSFPIGVISFVFMLLLNPKRWYRKMALGAFTSFLGSLLLNWEMFGYTKTENSFLGFKITETPVIISIVLLLLTFAFGVLDYLQNKK